MATLHCRHCGAEIDSDARRAQCRECRALFPFQCAVCERNLRPPFPTYEDERHLTQADPPQPLCEEHFQRKCPDCSKWFPNDQNPGYFRCLECAQKAPTPTHSEWNDAPPESNHADEAPHGLPTIATTRGGIDPNTLVLGGAGCAFLALLGWFFLGG